MLDSAPTLARIMPRPTHHVRIRRSRASLPPVALALVAFASAAVPAAETSPALLSRFTRQVQPLILNKCAAGACHGGPSAHPPQFQRGDVSGQLNRSITLANIEALTAALEKRGDLTAFLAVISRRHPAGAATGGLQLVPLTPQERASLEGWLVSATGMSDVAGNTTPSAGGYRSHPATAAKANATPPPNRFRAMLDAAANPLPLPPPQQPAGIILGKDRDG